MKKSILTKASILSFILIVSAYSCKKSSSDDTTTSTTADNSAITAATVATNSESMYDDAFNVVLQSGEQTDVNTTSAASAQSANANGENLAVQNTALNSTACAIITLSPQDPSVFPKTMTIDYGSGCTSEDGVTRKGKLIVSLSGSIRAAGSTISITFSGYSVNGYALTGTYAYQSNSAAGGGINYTATITGGSITLPTGAVYTYSGTETFAQTAGIATTTVTDDSYAITGNFSTSGPGGSISGTITKALSISYDCKNISSGTIAFVDNGVNAVLDFGSGACDNIATITAGPVTKTITLGK